MGAVNRDRFLNGKLNIWQPTNGYRAGVDPVFLAAAVAAKPGQSVLELGCGVGVASLCLGWRVSGLDLTGIEVQPEYADLANRNSVENDIHLNVVLGNLTDLPDAIRAQSFDHVIANPPYFQRKSGTSSADRGRDMALGGGTPLEAWFEAAIRRLKPRGFLTMIQKVDRIPDMFRAMDDRIGDVVVKPLVPRTQRDAELVILRARKSAKGAFRLAPPLVLHRGKRHEKDGESYRKLVQAILRDGAPLEI